MLVERRCVAASLSRLDRSHKTHAVPRVVGDLLHSTRSGPTSASCSGFPHQAIVGHQSISRSARTLPAVPQIPSRPRPGPSPRARRWRSPSTAPRSGRGCCNARRERRTTKPAPRSVTARRTRPSCRKSEVGGGRSPPPSGGPAAGGGTGKSATDHGNPRETRNSAGPSRYRLLLESGQHRATQRPCDDRGQSAVADASSDSHPKSPRRAQPRRRAQRANVLSPASGSASDR